VRSWIVIPAMAVVCGGAALALGLTPAVALAGAGLAAMVRVLAGDAPAALTGAALAPLLAVASFAESGGVPARAALALAAAGAAVVELVRPVAPRPSGSSGYPAALVAVASAATAALLDPRFVALLALVGLRLVAAQPRSRGALAVALAGAAALALAVIAGTLWPGLGAWWYGAPADPATPRALAALAGAALGPITSVAALAGIASLARARHAELAVAAAVASAVLVDLRAGALGASTVGLAALLSGLAIARLSAMLRLPPAQAVTGAALGALVLLPPAWTAIERRPPAAHAATLRANVTQCRSCTGTEALPAGRAPPSRSATSTASTSGTAR
jgi:hypothetical protein